MAESSIDRVSRALDLIPYLLEHPGSSISELAQAFDTSEKNIAGDLSVLHMCGLPGYSHLELIDLNYEDSDFIEVLEPQNLGTARALTRSESASLLLGLAMLEELAGSAERQSRIQALRSRLEERWGSSAILSTTSSAEGSAPHFEAISRAIAEGQTVTFTYFSRSNDLEHAVELAPVSLTIESGFAYLRGFEFATNLYKSYRTDRIENLELGRIEEPPLELAPDSAAEMSRVGSIIKLGLEGQRFIERHGSIIQEVQILSDGYLVKLQGVDQNWLIQELLGLGTTVEVISPDALAQALTQRAAQASALYTRYAFAQGSISPSATQED
jgi:proteasome accessory factor C